MYLSHFVSMVSETGWLGTRYMVTKYAFCVLTSVATTELSSYSVIETEYLGNGVLVENLVKQEKTSKLLYIRKLQEYSTSLPS